MDWTVKHISIPLFLWYLLPGLNFVVIVILIPVAFLSTQTFTRYSSLGNVVTLLIASLILGFIMDSLKLYQFTVGYKRTKERFFSDVSDALGVAKDEALVLFEPIRAMLQKSEPFHSSILTEHSRWVMVNLTSKCFFLLGITFVIALVLLMTGHYKIRILHYEIQQATLYLPFVSFLAVFSFGIGGRLSRISKQLQRMTNSRYITFLRSHKREILAYDPDSKLPARQ